MKNGLNTAVGICALSVNNVKDQGMIKIVYRVRVQCAHR